MMRVHRVGFDAVLLEFEDSTRVRAAYLQADADRRSGILAAIDLVPGEHTLLIDGVEPAAALLRIGDWHLEHQSELPSELIELPITYDGPDLDQVARRWDCTTADVGRIHASLEFTVAFCGFAPGFAYCTGLPESLQVPRRPEPRTSVPAGSVGLAGKYTGVYPRSSPGGWQLIGRVGVTVWDETAEDPLVLKPGARVRFIP